MMKQVCLLFLLFSFQSLSSQELTLEQQKFVSQFISLVKQKNKTKLAEIVQYPLSREKPLPSINNKKEFVQLFDEIFDESLIKNISNSNPRNDWSEIGWRGISFDAGLIWLDASGQLIAINYQSKAEKEKKEKLLVLLKSKLHESIRSFKKPSSIIETDKFRVRVDELNDGSFRYSSWSIKKAMSEKPDIVLVDGMLEFDGSIGNRNYIFQNQGYFYEVYIYVDGEVNGYDAALTVRKGEKIILSQKGRQLE